MNDFNRRQFLKDVLGKLAQAAGTVVLASTAAPASTASEAGPEAEPPPEDLRQRADQLAALGRGEFGEAAANAFLNVNIGRRPGWRNGGWPNVGWRNGWHNGGWPNVGWRNGIWHNGGWPNVGWRNFWG